MNTRVGDRWMNEGTLSRIDRYELRERIGSGGMARVFKGWDTTLERLVAIKILHDHLADDPTFKDRFEREAKFVAGINHPNIVQVYDFNVIERDGYPLYYMVMSYVPGKTLRETLEEMVPSGKRLSQQRILDIMMNLSDALGYAHAQGTVHRDVKPGNIIFNENDQAVLTDFGIARMAQSSRLTQDGVSTGTPTYMSPEQASGEAGDVRSDLYSLSVILFEMLTGRPPFDDEGGLSVMLKHLNSPVPLISDVLGTPNPKLDLFMQIALAKNPEDRFQTAQEYALALKSIFNDDDLTLPFPPLPARTSAPSATVTTSLMKTLSMKTMPRPSRGLIALVAGLLMVLFVVLLFNLPAFDGLLGRNQPSSPTRENVPSMTTGATYFSTRFNENDAYARLFPVGIVGQFTRELTPDGFYHLLNQREQSAVTAIADTPTVYNNVIITLEASLQEDSHPASAYGIAFRYQDENNYNVFAADGMGRYSIWVLTDGTWRELRAESESWTEDEIIEPIGGQNRLVVDIVGNRFTGYVNNRRVTQVFDETFTDGRVGIYIASDEGIANVLVDSFQVFSSIPSMTG
jgi:serine/threonine protein kinase